MWKQELETYVLGGVGYRVSGSTRIILKGNEFCQISWKWLIAVDKHAESTGGLHW